MTNQRSTFLALSALLGASLFSATSSANTDVPAVDIAEKTVAAPSSVVAAKSSPVVAPKTPSAALRELLAQAPIRFGEDLLLRKRERQSLRKLVVPMLADCSWKKLVIVGHAYKGTFEGKNRQLGLERAIEVRDYLVKSGFRRDVLEIRTAGSTQPILRDRTSLAGQVNRRVDLIAMP